MGSSSTRDGLGRAIRELTEPVSCVSDRGRHRSVQWNPEKAWGVRREAQYRSELGCTNGRIAREGPGSSRGLSSPPPLEPLGPVGFCLDGNRRLRRQNFQI